MSLLSAYRTPPQQERKAADEFRQAGKQPFVPTECREHRMGRHRKVVVRRHPVAPGYVFALGVKPHDAVYVRQLVGSVRPDELSPLYERARIRPVQRGGNPFKEGDAVIITKGRFAELAAKVTETRGRMCIIAFDMLGKTHQQAIAYGQLRPG